MRKRIYRTSFFDSFARLLTTEETEAENIDSEDLKAMQICISSEAAKNFKRLPPYYFVETNDNKGNVVERRCYDKRTHECRSVATLQYDNDNRLVAEEEDFHAGGVTYHKTRVLYHDGALTTAKSIVRYAQASDKPDTLIVEMYDGSFYEKHEYALATGTKLKSQLCRGDAFIRYTDFFPDGSYTEFSISDQSDTTACALYNMLFPPKPMP